MDGYSTIKSGSDRNFGLVFAAVFAIVAALPLFSGGWPMAWAAAISLAFLAVALIRPQMLAPLNKLWFKLGLLIGRVVSPVVMGLIFLLTVIPTGLLLRLLGKDPLDRKFDRETQSYWHVRKADEPAGSMKNQF